MNLVVVASMIQCDSITDGQKFRGWHGSMDGTLNALSCILGDGTVQCVFRIGNDDIEDFFDHAGRHYDPVIEYDGIVIDPLGTNLHRGEHEDEAERMWAARRPDAIRFEDIEPLMDGFVNVVLFNAGDVNAYEDDALARIRAEHPEVLVYVDVHRKVNEIFEGGGYMTTPGWPGWEKALSHCHMVQMNRPEASALLKMEIPDIEAAKAGVSTLLNNGVEAAVITLGSDGCVV